MEINTIKELIFWSYANLAMAHSAVTNKQQTYSRINFMVRSRLYKGLMAGKMEIGSIFEDERIKMLSASSVPPNFCAKTWSIDKFIV